MLQLLFLIPKRPLCGSCMRSEHWTHLTYIFYLQQFIQMTSDSYVSVYLMEYVWKTEQMSEEGKTSIAGNSTGEEKSLEEDIEEEQGE